VPQRRRRVIFVGVRDDLRTEPVFPHPLPYRYSFREALLGLPPVRAQKITSDEEVSDDVAAAIDEYAIGTEYDRLNQGQASDRFFNLKRLDPMQPCQTITAGGGGAGAVPGSVAAICHPDEKRKLSVSELRRLSGFPDDFVIKGTYAEQYERIGNSVPPPLMLAVAEVLRDRVLLPARAAARKPAPAGRSRPSSTTTKSPKDGARPRTGTRARATT